MDLQALPERVQARNGTPPAAAPSSRARHGPLGRAQPVMGQREGGVHPPGAGSIAMPAGLPSDGEPVIRRRASSGGGATPASHAGWQELTVLKRIADDIRRENDAGVNKSEKTLRGMGCDPGLIEQVIGWHRDALRALRTLAGGVKPTQAQRTQALALYVFDLHRRMCDRERLGSTDDDAESSALPGKDSRTALALLVRGAQRLASFDGLLPTIALWARLRMDPHGSEGDIMRLTLVNHTGLFETNARRLLAAYAEAMAVPPSASATSAGDEELLPRMRVALTRQWLAGPGERERAGLDRLCCDSTEIFHRKLMQQYALLCRRFGQPLPPMTELILVDDAD